jgi:hypothetical protein
MGIDLNFTRGLPVGQRFGRGRSRVTISVACGCLRAGSLRGNDVADSIAYHPTGHCRDRPLGVISMLGLEHFAHFFC